MELKPCPFCGETNLFVEEEDWGWVVYCGSCPAFMDGLNSKEEVIDKWNTRVKL